MGTKHISELDDAAPLTGTEQLAIAQAGLTRKVTASDIWAFAESQGLRWRGPWQAGTYAYNDVVRRGPWTSVVVNAAGTSALPFPQHSGTPAWLLPDSPTWEVVDLASVTTLTTVLRLTSPGWIAAIRVLKPSIPGASTDVSVRYAVGTDWETTITLIENQPGDAASTGWLPVPLAKPLFVPPDTTVDITRVTRSQSTATSTTARYDYVTPQNPVVPTTGQALHSAKDPGLLRVNKTGADSIDNSTMLATIVAGSEISVSDQAWTVSSAQDQGAWVDFRVSPATQSRLSGQQTFTFAVPNPAASSYRQLTDFFAGDPDTHGLIQIDDNVPTVTDDAYGIDAEFEGATMSPDWQVMAYSATY